MMNVTEWHKFNYIKRQMDNKSLLGHGSYGVQMILDMLEYETELDLVPLLRHVSVDKLAQICARHNYSWKIAAELRDIDAERKSASILSQ